MRDKYGRMLYTGDIVKVTVMPFDHYIGRIDYIYDDAITVRLDELAGTKNQHMAVWCHYKENQSHVEVLTSPKRWADTPYTDTGVKDSYGEDVLVGDVVNFWVPGRAYIFSRPFATVAYAERTESGVFLVCISEAGDEEWIPFNNYMWEVL